MKRILRFILLLTALGLTGPAFAHDSGFSIVQGRLRTDHLELSGSLSLPDVTRLLIADSEPLIPWSQEEFVAREPQLRELALRFWAVRRGTVRLPPPEVRLGFHGGDNVSFHLVYPLPPATGPITLSAPGLARLPPEHRQLITILQDGSTGQWDKLIAASDPVLEFTPAPNGPKGAAAAPGFREFFILGIEHIWTGYDHLLFLFGLLVVCRSFRSIVIIITCFTFAHSLTLALATLHLVNLPAPIVEPIIAASIVFVGLENLWRRGDEPKTRWALTFIFGLLHGFGFASVLSDLGVGAPGGEGIALPRFSFNLGVESGQIAVAAVVLPIVWQLRKKEAFLRRGVPILSAIVALAGLYWLLERTLFSL